MRTREEAVRRCLELPGAYEDYPFDDPNWTVMRRRDTKRGFCWIFERQGNLWMNLKVEPDWGDFWKQRYSAVRPAYHMNKTHWISLILDGTVPEEEIRSMVYESYRLCGRKRSTETKAHD